MSSSSRSAESTIESYIALVMRPHGGESSTSTRFLSRLGSGSRRGRMAVKVTRRFGKTPAWMRDEPIPRRHRQMPLVAELRKRRPKDADMLNEMLLCEELFHTPSGVALADFLLGDRDSEFFKYPLRQIDQPPAHHAVDRRDRTTFDHAGKCSTLAVVELGWLPRRLAVQETIRPSCVEA